MPRPKAQLPLHQKVARAFAAVGKLQRAGTNGRYNWTRATDVLEAVREKLFSQDVLILPNEATPVYVDLGESNGGPRVTECRLAVTYVFTDGKESLPPITINGEGRCTEGKSVYKAQTGAQKALLKRFGLMAEEADDPEFDGRELNTASHDVHSEHNVRSAERPVTGAQRRAFAQACAESGKTDQQVMEYLFTVHKVSNVSDLRRGKPFTEAIRWASAGGEQPAPKPQAAPALQGKLPMTTPAPPIELRIGNKTVSFEPQKKAYSV